MPSRQLGLARTATVPRSQPAYRGGIDPEDSQEAQSLVLEQIRLLTDQIRQGLASQVQKRDVERYGGALPGTPEWETKWNEAHRQYRLGRELTDVNQQITGLERPSGQIPMEDVWARRKGIAVGTPDRPMGAGLRRYEVEEGGGSKRNDLLQRKYAMEGLLTKQGLPQSTQRLLPEQSDTSKMWGQPIQDETGNIFQMGPNGQLIRRMPAQREPQETVNPFDQMDYRGVMETLDAISKMVIKGVGPDGLTPLKPEEIDELNEEYGRLQTKLTGIRGRYSRLSGGGGGGTMPREGTRARNDKTGEELIFQGGRWVSMKGGMR